MPLADFPLKSAPVIEVCIVAVLSFSSPLKMNCDNALLSKASDITRAISAIIGEGRYNCSTHI
jgi:hypothetical protein